MEGFVGCGGALVGEGVHAETPNCILDGGADGGDDVGVGSAAADVAGHALADLVVGQGGSGVWPVCQETMLSLPFLCSSRRAVAEQIWPGVQ